MCTRMSTTLRFNSSFSDWNWNFLGVHVQVCVIDDQWDIKNTDRILVKIQKKRVPSDQ